MRPWGILIVTIGILAAILADASGEIKSEAAKEAVDAYQRATTELYAKNLASTIEALQKYLKDLQAASVKVVTEGKVEEGLEIGRLIKRVESRIQFDQAQLSFLQPRAVFEVKGSGFKLKLLRNSATAYSNRDFVWTGLPEQLDGWQFTQIAGGDTPEMNLEIKQGGVVFVAANSTTELQKDGWQPLVQLNFAFTQKNNNRLGILSKQFKPGDTVKIQHYGWAGTLVLIPNKQPAVLTDL
jgi:hypothetical protein